MADQHDAHVGQTRPDQFDREIGWRAVFVFMLVITLITAGAFGSMWYFGLFMRDTMAQGDQVTPLMAERTEEDVLPPLPRLQTTSYDDWADMKDAMDEQLSTYAWEDEARGLVRIPIEDAMQRIATQGLPEFPPAPEAGTAPAETGSGTPVENQ